MLDPLCYIRSNIETHHLHPDVYSKHDLPMNVDPLVWRFDCVSYEKRLTEAFGDCSLQSLPFRPFADLFIEVYTYIKDISTALLIRDALENNPLVSPIPKFFPFDKVVKWDLCFYTPSSSPDTSGLDPQPDYTIRFRRTDSGIFVVGSSDIFRYFHRGDDHNIQNILRLFDSELDTSISYPCSEEKILESIVKGVSHEHAMPLLLEYFEIFRQKLDRGDFDREWHVSEGVQEFVSDGVLRQIPPHEKN